MLKEVNKARAAILKIVLDKLKLVPKGFYRTQWMMLGMTIFGIPIGVAFGAALGNMGLLGTGLPIGMALGIGLGMAKDKKAETEGLQLDV